MSFDIGGVEIYSLEEISKKLGVDVDSLKKCAKKGDLVARKVGDTFFVTAQNLLAFLQAPAPSPARKPATPKPAAAEKPEKVEKPAPKPKAKEVTEVAKPITVLPSELPLSPGETPPSEIPTAEFKSVVVPPPPPPPPPRLDPMEERRQAALLATKRRQESSRGGTGVVGTRDVPGNGSPVVHKTLLESDEMPVPMIEDLPGASKPTETRHAITTSKPSTRPFEAIGTEVAPLTDIPDMFGPESPTLVLRPELSELREESSEESLKDLAQQGRVARKERDDIITRIRKLPLDDQTKAISGPEGTKLMQLDKIIEEGQKAEHALGVAPSPITNPHTPPPHAVPPVESAAPFVEIPPSPEARAEKEPPPPEATEAEARVSAPAAGTGWVPAGKPQEAAKPTEVEAFEFDLISRPSEPEPPSPTLDAKGGETWQEVGMPSPVGAPDDYQLKRGHMQRAEKVTLSFTEDERKLMADLKIAEATAAHEIMEKFAPANEKAWEYAKHRYFQPLRMRQISW